MCIIKRSGTEWAAMSNPVGALSNRTSMDLIMFSVFTFENLEEGTNTPFSLLTQKT
jgi:hypothetical protein